jgi:hypothetical protein
MPANFIITCPQEIKCKLKQKYQWQTSYGYLHKICSSLAEDQTWEFKELESKLQHFYIF